MAPAGPTLADRLLRGLIGFALASASFITVGSERATASHQFLTFTKSGDSSAIFGANEGVVIDGAIEFYKGCGPDGLNDFFYPIADVYITAGDLSGGLADRSGTPNTVFGVGGGAFASELIGYTGPTGSLGPGVYSIVFDECQNGKLDPEDAVFPDAITVRLPTDVPPLPDAEILAAKNRAGELKDHWENAHTAYTWLFKLEEWAESKAKKKDIAAKIKKYTPKVFKYFGINEDVKTGALNTILATSQHYGGIAADPPDSNFAVSTEIGARESGAATSILATENAGFRLGAASSVEGSIARALLTALERYQGADLEGDGTWALAQARTIAEYASLLAGQLDETDLALDKLQTVLGAFPGAFDVESDDFETFQADVIANGLPTEARALLANLGATAAQTSEIASDILADDFAGISEAGISALVSDMKSDNAAWRVELGDLATAMAAVIATLEADPTVVDEVPVARAGGPYTAQTGTPVGLDASTSSSPAGAIEDFHWDLDGDGSFDDAVGPTPSFTFDEASIGLVGVRVTDVQGGTDVAYAPVRVTTDNRAPSVNAFSPDDLDATAVIGVASSFSVTASDPDGDAISYEWFLDGAPVADGSDSFSLVADAAALGPHHVSARISDGVHAIVVEWSLDVGFEDRDGDGWNANVDCDDDDASVNPGQSDVANGIDDDCDPSTPDGGEPPVVDAGPNVAVVEGDTVALAASFSHNDTTGFVATVDWGEGAGPEPASVAGTSVDGSHVYTDDGARPIEICVTSPTGSVGCDQAVIEVLNAPPVVTSPPGAPGDELFTNGDLEAGTAGWFSGDTDWRACCWQGTVGNPGGGFILNQTGSTESDPYLGQSVDGVTPGAVYRISGDYISFVPFYGDPSKPDAFRVRVRWLEDTEVRHVDVLGLPRPSPATTWTQFTTEFVAPASSIDVIFLAELDGDDSSFTVDNLSLRATGSADSGVEGADIDVTVSFDDAGTADTHTARIEWGDGAPTDAANIDQRAGGGEVSGSHAYGDDGTYGATVCVTDDDGGRGCAMTIVVVENLPPVVEAGPDVVGSLGLALAPAWFTDPGPADTHTATVDWGDGSSSTAAVVQAAGSGSVEASHMYETPGVHVVEVCVVDDDGGEGCDTFTADVRADAAPSITAVEEGHTFAEGAEHVHLLAFEDDDRDAEHTVTVDWGDGSATMSASVNEAGGFGTASASHTYADDGLYTVTWSVCDLDGCTEATVDESVTNVAPVTDAVDPLGMTEFDTSTVLLATFGDAGLDDTHTATIDWGEGDGPEVATVDQSSGGGTVSGAHEYRRNGLYDVTVCVTDDDGATHCDATRIEVDVPVGTIVITKNADPATGTQFEFSSDTRDAASFALADGEQITMVEVRAGSYEIVEADPGPDFLVTGIECDDGDSTASLETRTASVRLAESETVSCTFSNLGTATIELAKTTDGAIDAGRDWRFELYEGPQGFGGFVVGADSSRDDADGVLDFDDLRLDPRTAYTACELGVPAGWSSRWSIDTTGDGVPDTFVIPYNPDGPAQDLGNRCFDVGAATSYPITPGGAVAMAVDNRAPGGDPRSPGYWKNWSTCTNGGQADNAARNGGADEGFFLLDDILSQPGVSWGNFTVSSCEAGVTVLDQRDLNNGKKRANDAAYTVAMHLLATDLNLGAGASSCQQVLDSAAAARALLIELDFDGTGGYLRSRAPLYGPALDLASTLDAYNNGTLC